MQRMTDVSGTVQSASIWGAAQRTKRCCAHRMGPIGGSGSLIRAMASTGSSGSLPGLRVASW